MVHIEDWENQYVLIVLILKRTDWNSQINQKVEMHFSAAYILYTNNGKDNSRLAD